MKNAVDQFKAIDLRGVVADGHADGASYTKSGDYLTEVANVWRSPAKSGKGTVLRVLFLDPHGRSVCDFLNIENSNKMAERIGLSRLKALMYYGGHNTPGFLGDIDSLIGMWAKITVEVDNDGYAMITNYQGVTTPDVAGVRSGITGKIVVPF